MARRLPSRRLRIEESIATAIEKKMSDLERREDLSRFVEWLCALYLKGWLVEDYQRMQEKSALMGEEPRRVGKVVGARVAQHDDETKRKVS